jgi:hypothetical protein
MALFHRHKHVDAVLTAVSWRRATIIEHSHRELVEVPNAGEGNTGTHTEERTVWREGRVVASGGDSQSDVHWVEFSLWPNERVGKQTESYTAIFKATDDSVAEADKVIEAKLHEKTWQTLRIGATYQLEFGILGHVHHVVPVLPPSLFEHPGG